MFQEKGFFISISLTLLLAGLIIFYVTNKFKAVESSIAKQNDILSDFIINVRNEIGGGGATAPSGGSSPVIVSPTENSSNDTKEILLSGPISNDATLEAKIAAETYLSKKIEVSDDEQTDEESEGESDESEESESESDSDDETVGETKQINIAAEDPIDADNDVKVIDVGETKTIASEELALPELTPLDILNDPSNIKAINLSDVMGDMVSDVGLVDDDGAAEIPTPAETPSTNDVLNELPFKKRKVEDLRKIAVDNNLTSQAEASKMRKPDLVNLIEANQDNLV